MADKIDSRIEEPARLLLGCVLEEELDQLERTLKHVTENEELFIPVMTLVGRVATFAVVRRCDDRKPTEDDAAIIASEIVKEYEGSFPLEEADVYSFIAHVLIGGESFDSALGVDKSVLVPLVVTAVLLATDNNFETWNEHLDTIEAALEEVGNTSYLTARDIGPA